MSYSPNYGPNSMIFILIPGLLLFVAITAKRHSSHGLSFTTTRSGETPIFVRTVTSLLTIPQFNGRSILKHNLSRMAFRFAMDVAGCLTREQSISVEAAHLKYASHVSLVVNMNIRWRK